MTEGRTIAIGDVHGCPVALAALVRAIDPAPLDTLVFLGDYIDRGPDSRGVLEQVIALRERCVVVPLLGNHEEMLLAALEGQSELRYWLKFGGTEALASYGYRGGPELRPADLRALIPSEHVRFLKGCRDYFKAVRPRLRPRRLTRPTAAAHPCTALLRQGRRRGPHAGPGRDAQDRSGPLFTIRTRKNRLVLAGEMRNEKGRGQIARRKTEAPRCPAGGPSSSRFYTSDLHVESNCDLHV
jgi:hypothetical protein